MTKLDLPEFEKLVLAAGRKVLRLLPLAIFALPWLIPALLVDIAPLFMTPPINLVAHGVAEAAASLIALIGMVELFRRSCYASLGVQVPMTGYSMPDAQQWRLIGQVVIVVLLVLIAALVLTAFSYSQIPGKEDTVLFWASMALWPMGRLVGLFLAYDLVIRLAGTATQMPLERLTEAIDRGRGLRFMIALGLTAMIWPMDALGASVQYVLLNGPGSVPFIVGDKIPAEGLPSISIPVQILETLFLPIVTLCAAVWLSGWLRILDEQR